MILEGATHISEALDQPEIIAVLGEDKVFWELAETDTALPFLVFSVSDNGSSTKDRFVDLQARLRIFADSMTQSAEIAKVIRNTIKENPSYRWKDRGGTSGYTDTEAKEGFIEITYEFKLT